MVKHCLGPFVFLTIGVFIGMLWSKTEEPAATIVAPKTNSGHQRTPAQLQRTANLEAEITRLKQRLGLLEQEVHKRDRAADRSKTE